MTSTYCRNRQVFSNLSVFCKEMLEQKLKLRASRSSVRLFMYESVGHVHSLISFCSPLSSSPPSPLTIELIVNSSVIHTSWMSDGYLSPTSSTDESPKSVGKKKTRMKMGCGEVNLHDSRRLVNNLDRSVEFCSSTNFLCSSMNLNVVSSILVVLFRFLKILNTFKLN